MPCCIALGGEEEMKRHRSKDCARIEKAEDGGKDQGGGAGKEEDTKRAAGLERKSSSCGEAGGWRGWGGTSTMMTP